MVAVGQGLPRRGIVDEFQRLWYGGAVGLDHTYFGLKMTTCPLDMAIYAEVVPPERLVWTEAGTGVTTTSVHLIARMG